MGESDSQWTGRLAVAAGIASAGCALSLAIYFAVGGPFGTINDYGNGIAGVLGGALAWRMRSRLEAGARRPGVALGLAGAALTVVGSALVISKTTGFLFASLVSSVGFAAIGGWLVLLSRSGAIKASWPRRLRELGIVAGAVMAVGVVMVPGIVARYDELATIPGWVWIGMVGWLGIYVLYPAWAIWLGVREMRSAGATTPSSQPGRLAEGEEVASWTRG